MRKAVKDSKLGRFFYPIFIRKYLFASSKKHSPGDACNVLKESLTQVLQVWYFRVNFEKFLSTPFLIEHLWWLLLNILENFSQYFKFSCLRTSFFSNLHLRCKALLHVPTLMKSSKLHDNVAFVLYYFYVVSVALVPLEVIFQNKHHNTLNVKKERYLQARF